MDRVELLNRLRKVATALRERGAEEEKVRVKMAAHTLRAAKGLTLLREKVRGG